MRQSGRFRKNQGGTMEKRRCAEPSSVRQGGGLLQRHLYI
ncbi:hypothetical protein GBL_1707 [Geobacillus kaustophilus GBlys]|uniref:Uncharacterized protein n=1 Tax=Geobacillus kaustophilus GBlys TaxID=1337888 RepID=U2X3W8_GEOKU|nr:hypothetical protein GBL_1707 [Geobacillus kaustophilus GBlys]